mgnify:CR=1 FL=1
MRIDQETIQQNSPIHEYSSHVTHEGTIKVSDNQDYEDLESDEQQQCQSPIHELQLLPASSISQLLVKKRSNTLIVPFKINQYESWSIYNSF